ncbi:MAG: hypothetical protein ACUVQU_06865 [Candidatus Bipolaricaulia bacterium]
MWTMIETYLSGMALTDRARELLRKGVEGRRIALWDEPRCTILALLKGLKRGERLGQRLGREIYEYYCELLELGLPQDRALELTKSLIEGLARGAPRRGRSRPSPGQS